MQIEDFLDQYGQIEADKYSIQQDVMDGLMNHKSSVDSEEYPPVVVVVSTKQSVESSLGSL